MEQYKIKKFLNKICFELEASKDRGRFFLDYGTLIEHWDGTRELTSEGNPEADYKCYFSLETEEPIYIPMGKVSLFLENNIIVPVEFQNLSLDEIEAKTSVLCAWYHQNKNTEYQDSFVSSLKNPGIMNAIADMGSSMVRKNVRK